MLALALLGACGTLPGQVDRPVSHGIQAAPAQSRLARVAEASLPQGAPSAFRLLPFGVHALDARLALIEGASRSIDLQVYIMANDASGRAVFAALRDAAARGVRVRLLLDDLSTTGAEELIEALAALPNFEIRLFNPFCCLRDSFAGRLLSSLGDARRLNHRMHNKLLVADGALAIFGGRNIADEYFGLDPRANFIDLDAIAAGRVVPQFGDIFDRYWNSEDAFPVAAVTGRRIAGAQAEATLARLLPAHAARIDLGPPETDLLGRGPVGTELAAGRLSLLPAVAYAVADRPTKRQETPEDLEFGSLRAGAEANMLGTRSDLVVVSPYLVPGRRGMAMLQSLQLKGVDMTVVTNSLTATDAPLVYFGYARYRVGIAKAGVRLYEISADPRPSGGGKSVFGGSSRGRLHAKLVVIDHQTLLLGSLNLDPRSARENTEVGAAIDSPALAQEALRIIDAMKAEAYRVRLDAADGMLSWVPPSEDDDQALDEEPGVSPLNALERLLLRPLVPEDQL